MSQTKNNKLFNIFFENKILQTTEIQAEVTE